MSKRIVIIESEYIESQFLPFDSSKLTDSEALHMFLTQIDPGEEYTVTFKNELSETISTGICQCENSYCKHGKEEKMCENTPTNPNHQIIYIGQVCAICYSIYPIEYHVNVKEN